MRENGAPVPADPLGPEWARIEVLCRCLAASRAGEEMPQEVYRELGELQAGVLAARASHGGWDALANGGLHEIEYDILACAIAPEAEPRLALRFQWLQPGAGMLYPTPALIQDLFALSVEDTNRLYAALSEHGQLRRRHLIEAEDLPSIGVAFRPLRAAPSVLETLLGRPAPVAAPPGTLPVRNATTLSELVVPASQRAMLNELLMLIRHRDTVLDRWGGKALGGPVALFSGPAGTGKTAAASAIAEALGWPLFRVDMGLLVSKYVGETEKNLNRLLDAAHGQPLVLLFDEADSLFGRRGDIREARDRYANMEVSHLLARIEAHEGPCVLTTNLRQHLDGAFARRFQLVVEFPRPDAPARTQLWAQLLPPRAPREPEVEPHFLARALALSGGEIRSAALYAAFLAADRDAPIGLRDIAVAVWRELAKPGHDRSLEDLGQLASHLPEELA